jgi:ATP-dependent RNA helicase DeaD
MADFEGVSLALNNALKKREYTELTPVQQSMLDPDLDNKDLLVSAQTGSGKTVAFGIAIAPTLLGDENKFKRADAPLALVVAPTRELALQVKRELDWLYAETGAIITSCVGGMDIRTERRNLERGAHIVVGTPGRLCDHIRRRALDVRQMQAVVLDEADEMLDLGFKEDLEFILETTPETRRTLMFSATVPASIGKLAKQYQNDAVRVQTSEEQKQHVDIEYRALVVAPRERENAIINVLRYYESENAIIFCNTRATVNHMMARLNNRGFSVVALSGEFSQTERTHALQSMRDGRARVCIATDVAARGIDLPKLELVIHAELPNNPETLLHRSGRTGRAGRKGVSAMIIDQKGRKRAERLLRFAKINAEWASPPSADDVIQRDEERILADPILTNPIEENEKDLVEKLLENFTIDQLATAFARLSHKDRSAPEDVQAVSFDAPKPGSFKDRPERGGREGGRKRREEFDESVWFTISVGRKQNAEPRWLIPLLCKSGDITKADIGVIKMQQEDTLIQLDAAQAESFFDKIGPNQTIDKNIKVKRLPGKPKEGAEPYVKPSGGKKKWDDKPRRGKRERDQDRDNSFRDKPYKEKLSRNDTMSDAPKPKKSFKPKNDSNREGHELHTKPPLDMDALGKKPFKKKTKDKAALKEGWAKKKSKGAAKSKSRKPSGGRDTGGGNQGLKRKKD